MRVSSFSINGLAGGMGATPWPMPPVSEEEISSERNKYGRPYPWHCNWGGWLLSDECKPPTVEQGNKEAEDWINAKVEEGKLDPAIAQAGIDRIRESVEQDCAARPEDCANVDAFSESPTCVTLFGADFCNSLNSGNDNLLYVIGGAALILAGIAILRQ